MSVSSPSISTASMRVRGKKWPYARAVVPAALPRIAIERGGRGARGERQHEHLVPVVAGEVRAGPADRVHGLALVELERARAVGVLHDARVLVLGVGLVDDARAGVGLALDRPDRQREQRPRARPARARAARRASPIARDHDEHEAEDDERAPRADAAG